MYSSYSHLKEISVSQGDVVKKGQQIGFSGATGTATTPHLHFQIDTSDAPWHPFWPFTWKEAQDAGLDFFSAINAGLGKEKGEAVTINPLKYVQTYMDSSATYTAAVPSVSVTPSEPISATTASSYVPPASGSGTSVSTETASTTSTPPPENTSQAPVLNVDFNVNDTYYVGENTDFTVLLKDQYGKPFVNGFIGEMIISSTNGNFTSNSSIVNFLQFESGAKFKTGMKDLHEGKDKIKVIVNGQTYYSKQLQIADRVYI
ncbi:M23 family metallopeptidase [Candidatus Peregrinibacteria bacterium]|nr:M23 family metallopeptidase [Candidatus Peregrinibacteria bacterium]